MRRGGGRGGGGLVGEVLSTLFIVHRCRKPSLSKHLFGECLPSCKPQFIDLIGSASAR